MRLVDLLVKEGPDAGMRYTVEEGAYRVVGRRGPPTDSTVQLTRNGDRMLDPQQQAALDGAFAVRTDPGVRTRFRRRGPDILIGDNSVSRTHAAVFVENGSISVADLMSTNGTRVNGAPVSDHDLRPGDQIQIGQTVFEIAEG